MSKQRSGRGAHQPRPITPVLAAARSEAELARHGYVGVEHLLLVLTRSDIAPVTQLLGGFAITPERARDAVWLVVSSGRGDGPRFDAATLLGTLGIDLDQIRRQIDRQFGPDALHHLYNSDVGWDLRPRGPLCEPPPTAYLKRAIDSALGKCWEAAPPHLSERLLLGALDAHGPGLGAVLDELAVSAADLRAAVASELTLAS
jgi:hypothetical protein